MIDTAAICLLWVCSSAVAFLVGFFLGRRPPVRVENPGHPPREDNSTLTMHD